MTLEHEPKQFVGKVLEVENPDGSPSDIVFAKTKDPEGFSDSFPITVSLNSYQSDLLDDDLMQLLDVYGVNGVGYVLNLGNVGYMSSHALRALEHFRREKNKREKAAGIPEKNYTRIVIQASRQVEDVFNLSNLDKEFNVIPAYRK